LHKNAYVYANFYLKNNTYFWVYLHKNFYMKTFQMLSHSVEYHNRIKWSLLSLHLDRILRWCHSTTLSDMMKEVEIKYYHEFVWIHRTWTSYLTMIISRLLLSIKFQSKGCFLFNDTNHKSRSIFVTHWI